MQYKSSCMCMQFVRKIPIIKKKKGKQQKKKRNQVIYRLNMGLDAKLKPF